MKKENNNTMPQIREEILKNLTNRIERDGTDYNYVKAVDDAMQITLQMVYNEEVLIDSEGKLEYID